LCEVMKEEKYGGELEPSQLFKKRKLQEATQRKSFRKAGESKRSEKGGGQEKKRGYLEKKSRTFLKPPPKGRIDREAGENRGRARRISAVQKAWKDKNVLSKHVKGRATKKKKLLNETQLGDM